MEYSIVIEGLTKSFGEFTAVDDLSIDVKRNRFVGFLGPNGAGKTTTLKILTNLLSATSGSAYLDGIDVTREPKKALMNVGCVVETPEFYPFFTPRETLQYLGRIRGMSKADIDIRTKEVLEQVQMEKWAEIRMGKFSKGMKQRIAIAQAIMHDPPIILLDEPSSGLDPRGTVEMRDTLQYLKKIGYTIFMSSHMLNEVMDLCDEAAIISNGKLIRHDTLEGLINESKTRKLQIKILKNVDETTAKKFGDIPTVSNVKISSENTMIFDLEGGGEEMADLVDDVRSMGLRLVSLSDFGSPLENLYMSLIKETK